jgi:hypothetical protein
MDFGGRPAHGCPPQKGDNFTERLADGSQGATSKTEKDDFKIGASSSNAALDSKRRMHAGSSRGAGR